MPITVIGSLNQDLVTYTNRVPNGGETVKGETFEHHLGGKGFNEVIALTRLKAPEDDIDIKLWGKVGDDGAGEQFLEALNTEHVNISQIQKISDCTTGTAVILVEKPTGENRIVIVPGANRYLHPSDDELDVYFDAHKRHFVVLQNEFSNSTKVIHHLKTFSNVSTVYNPSPLFVFDDDLLQALRESLYIIVNEHEALQIADNYQDNLHDVQPLKDDASSVQPASSIAKFVNKYVGVLAKLSNLLPKSTLVITMGGNGVLYRSSDTLAYAFVPSNDIPRKEIVDTTGCGDTFLGAFTLSIYKGESIKSAIEFANNAAGTAAMKNGAADSIPAWIDIQKKYYDNN